jgi:hypothetical protein
MDGANTGFSFSLCSAVDSLRELGYRSIHLLYVLSGRAMWRSMKKRRSTSPTME